MTAPLTFGSLFAGIGGFDLGFERAGMQCKWQVEIDPYCQRVLAKHWPGVRRWDDVRTWPQPDTVPVDVICGGFPCQDISFAGKGAGLNGERSGLFYEFARIIREMGPQIVVMENVAALLVRGLDCSAPLLLGTEHTWLPRPTTKANQRCPSMGKNGRGCRLAAEIGHYEDPQWVEWLMGFPDGWTDLEDLETP